MNNCLTCATTDISLLGTTRQLERHLQSVMRDLDTLNGIKTSDISSHAVDMVKENLLDRLEDNISHVSVLTKTLVQDFYNDIYSED